MTEVHDSQPQANWTYQAIAAALLAWYEAAGHQFPWRGSRDPYQVWVSEIMLQQTQVTTVIPYYRRFLKRFPTVEALAAAELDEVLAVWQGLGYYGRARSLHAAARLVLARHGGRVPDTLAELRALPGIGAYTAGAILSIAYGQDEPAVDANVVRVLCRLFDYAGDPQSAPGRRVLDRHARALLPPGRAGDLNQALMDHGRTICVPRAPRCLICPVAAWCRALALGVQEERPVRRARAARPERTALALVVSRGETLLVLRRQPQGLLGGLWEIPTLELLPCETLPVAARRLLDSLGLQGRVEGEAGVVRHGYTHFSLTVHVYHAQAEGEPALPAPWDAAHWLAPSEREAYGLTGVAHKALEAVGWE